MSPCIKPNLFSVSSKSYLSPHPYFPSPISPCTHLSPFEALLKCFLVLVCMPQPPCIPLTAHHNNLQRTILASPYYDFPPHPQIHTQKFTLWESFLDSLSLTLPAWLIPATSPTYLSVCTELPQQGTNVPRCGWGPDFGSPLNLLIWWHFLLGKRFDFLSLGWQDVFFFFTNPLSF